MTVSRVHVVVVAYHGADLLDHCLAALERSVDVTVVDNSSSTEIRAVADRHHAAHVDPGANLGFAAGVNAALRTLLTAPPRDVQLVNPDANVRPDTIAALANHLQTPGN